MPLHRQLEQSHRIAVFRSLQLGDMLCAVPALRALRAARPEATITLIGLPWAQWLARRLDRYVDDFVAFPGYPGIVEQPLDVRRLPDFFRQMQERRFDLALQLHGSGLHSNGFVLQLGARASAGFYAAGTWRPSETFWPYPVNLAEVRRNLVLLRHLGVDADDDRLEFPLTDDDRAELERAVGETLEGGYVCIHPGARDPGRRWPAERFAAVGDRLQRDGVRVVVTGTADEASITAAVANAMESRPIDLTGRLELGALAALLAGARLVVSNDTGVSHLADALHVPSVVIFVGSDPGRWAPLDRRLHRVVNAVVVEQPDACCLGERCPHATLRPAEVPLEAVLRPARELLFGRRAHAA